MNCKEMGEHLMDVAAGLPSAPAAETHLHSCADCRERLRQTRETMELLDEWKAPAPSPYFEVRLQARLREESARSYRFLDWLRRPALAAAMAFLLVIGGTLYTVGYHPQAPSTLGQAQPGAAVEDLQDLDKNHDLFANFDLLDDLAPDQNAQEMNP